MLFVVKNEKDAQSKLAIRDAKAKEALQTKRKIMSFEELMADTATGKELRVVLKSDVQGSTEAIQEAFTKYPTDRVKVKVIHAATGGINESDIMLAAASQAVVLGFNIRPDVKALKTAEREGVQVRTYTVIYEMIEEVKGMLEGLLDVELEEKVIGRAEVRETFSVPKVGMIAGSSVIDGKVTRGCFLRLLRDSRVVYEGKISSLRRFKDDVKEVASGYECGIGLENFNDLKPGDQLEAYIKEEKRGTL
jgi:translation initiation factor IF-2